MCQADDCGRAARGRTAWCDLHRQRVSRYGTPATPPNLRSLELQRSAFARVYDTDALTDGECWEWPGPRNASGYGIAAPSICLTSSRIVTRSVLAALRVTVPPGLSACHRCDNPPCFRPSHLFVGSARDNSADMVRKGRSPQARNEASGMHRLTNAQVAEIRSRRAAGETCADLARSFGVHSAHISRIARGLRRPDDSIQRWSA